jgi:NAD(P)-dependent dehydrogenase (short-subunit alcohol dehydrogenase family)
VAPEAYEAAMISNANGRLGQLWEIAHAVTFLCEEESSFITGVCLPVDGGSTAGKF